MYKLRQLSLPQFVYFLSTEPSVLKKVFCKSKHRWLCAQKIYKVRQTRLSQFVYLSEVLRGDKNQTFRTSYHYWNHATSNFFVAVYVFFYTFPCKAF